MRQFTPYLFLLLAASFLYSCKSAKLSDAEEKQRIGEYFEAAAIYRKVYTKTPPAKRDLRGYIAFRMAECNRLINNTPRATSAYMNALRYKYPDSIVNLRLGQMYQKSGRYGEAVKYYNDYLLAEPGSVLAFNGVTGCEEAVKWKQSPTRYTVKRMDKFNSRRSEFSPMLYGEKYDQLYFASTRAPKGAGKDKEETNSAITGQRNNDLFLVKQDENGAWLAPVELEDEVNTEFDEGTPSFSKDGNTMYYTYCAQDPEGPRTSEIYISSRSSAKWGKGTRANIVKDSVTALGHPSISPDGKYLYFVSDAVGGYGGKDLFRARVVGSDFGSMENLGPDINTPGDEMFPYVRDSVTLYFASDGHPGMGGLDIFKATLDSTGKWNVENMKAPINSSGDDFGITFAGKGQNLDTGAKVVHTGENTSSYINTRSISKDGGISTFRSSVTIGKNAKHSKAAVSCQSLMLDDISRSDTIPAMDIRTKDADVGHEAKIGKISDDAVFYLMSRGISEEDARAMIVSGFADNVSKELPLEYAVEMNNLIRLEMKGSIG